MGMAVEEEATGPNGAKRQGGQRGRPYSVIGDVDFTTVSSLGKKSKAFPREVRNGEPPIESGV